MDWNLISGICAVIGVGFLIYQFAYLPKKENREEKNALLAHFSSTRANLDKLIFDIESYVAVNQCAESLFAQDCTFRAQVHFLKEIRDQSLSDQLYNKLNDLDLTKQQMSLMVNDLNNQLESFQKTVSYFRGRFIHQ